MAFSRRQAIVGFSLAVPGIAMARITGAPDLIDPYDPDREAKLFPQPLPFLALFKKSGRTFGFAAVVHSSDAASPTFRLIDRSFALVRPAAVILEGFPTTWGPNPERVVRDRPAPSSYDDGEDAHAISLAKARGAAIWGGEPSYEELAKQVIQSGFDPADAFFAAMFGPLAQDLEAGVFSGPSDPRFGPAYSRWADRNAPAFGANLPRGPDAFRAWFERTYGVALDKDPDWSERGGPGQPGKAGDIARRSNLLRDRHMFGVAVKLTEEKRRVLQVCGGSHLSSQWRALNAAFGKPAIFA